MKADEFHHLKPNPVYAPNAHLVITVTENGQPRTYRKRVASDQEVIELIDRAGKRYGQPA